VVSRTINNDWKGRLDLERVESCSVLYSIFRVEFLDHILAVYIELDTLGLLSIWLSMQCSDDSRCALEELAHT